jgi:RAT1-interacting protein
VAVLKATITGDGVWRIRRKEKSPVIEAFKIEETGYGDILSDEFVTWRLSQKHSGEVGESLAMGMDTNEVPSQ